MKRLLITLLLLLATTSAFALANINILSKAIYNKDYAKVKLLIEEGADINRLDAVGKSAILNAISINDPKMVELILNYEPKLSTVYYIYGEKPLNFTALTFAIAIDCDYSLIKTLIDAGAAVDYTEGETSYCPLFSSIYHNRVDIMRLLLQEGANPNQYMLIDGLNMNAMYMVIGSSLEPDDRESIELLLESGFKIYADNEYIEYAMRWQKRELANYLIKRLPSLGPLEPWSKDAEYIRYLGISLVEAVYNLDYDLVELLLKEGADIDFANSKGDRALSNALITRDLTMLKLVLRYKPQLNNLFETPIGDATVLTVAVIYQYPEEMIELLIEQGAKTNRVEGEDLDGPFLGAIINDQAHLLQSMIENGVDLNETVHTLTGEELDALNFVAMSDKRGDDIKAVNTLLENGFVPREDFNYALGARRMGKYRLAGYLKKLKKEGKL